MREQQFVDIGNKEERQKFIEKLETNGYEIDTTIFSKDDIICGIFPIVVNLNNKKISMLGNVTTAAAAVSSGVLITQAEFEKNINLNS